MRRLILLLTSVLTAAVASVLCLTAAPSAGAATAVASVPPVPPVIDSMTINHLPSGLGTSSDFAYEFDDVRFVSRDWESRTDEGWRVDLSIDVLRGDRLSTPAALHDWVIAYEERPPAEAVYHRTTVRGHAAWRCADEVFWLVRPGVAMVVRLDTSRWSQHELTRTARGISVAATA